MEVRILPCAPFLWVKLVQEEHRAWNAEASGRSTLPRPIPLSFNGRTPPLNAETVVRFHHGVPMRVGGEA